ncbi:SpoIIE family protein phosphatase [Streptomyces adustus]|uniref:SpoIIE family protein phosphatase n=1 Tax=Streptomyces adustus TaxID=1609272 RepID=UPI0035E21B61
MTGLPIQDTIHTADVGPGVLLAGRATAVLDGRMRFAGWSSQAEAMFGYRPDEIVGRPIVDVLDEPLTVKSSPAAGAAPQTAEAPEAYVIRSVRHRDGYAVPTALCLVRLPQGRAGVMWLMVAMEVERLQRRAMDQAVLAGLYTQSPVMLVVYDTDIRIRWINTAIEEQLGFGLKEVAGRALPEVLPDGVLLTGDGRAVQDVERPIRAVLRTGRPVTDVLYQSTTPRDPDHPRVWSLSYFRLEDDAGRPIGVCEAGLDITDRYAMRRRLALLSRASGSIGTTLDIRRTADELAELAVPEFADALTVDLLEPVLSGQEPPAAHRAEGSSLLRVAERARDSAAGDLAASLDPLRGRCLTAAAQVADPVTGALALPLTARGTVLGVALLLRTAPRTPFDAEDIPVAVELVSGTALCLDNARRYVQEHATALTLQRDLLPHTLSRPAGVEVAHRYLPAQGPAGVGGDWYDVIPLSGARVGLLVGDVAGHGTSAAATMGRLRTTVAALSALDLAPDELLARLDDLVVRAGSASSAETGTEDRALGATCLYAVYDTVNRHCVMARAGHPPPVLLRPDGHSELVDVPAGPPLGLGGLPFESVDFELPEGSMLALFTDGLVESRRQDIDSGIRRLCDVLSRSGAGPLKEICHRVVAELLPGPPEDDAALLLVRTHALAGHLVGTWEIPADPGEVARARSLAGDKLGEWGVADEVAFIVELVVSELVTNAIRHGGSPIRLRLIREDELIVEVSDGGHTAPHLRRAGSEDEGGRGLFLVAQMTERWGTRYTPTGKTIWTEVPEAPERLPRDLAIDEFLL